MKLESQATQNFITEWRAVMNWKECVGKKRSGVVKVTVYNHEIP